MKYFSLESFFLLIFILNECVSKSINQDHLQLKFVFIVSTYTCIPKYTLGNNVVSRKVYNKYYQIVLASLSMYIYACMDLDSRYQFYIWVMGYRYLYIHHCNFK